jgi:hypothetical protein
MGIVEEGVGMSPIHREFGYEIYRTEDETLLIDRKTWPLSYVMGILGGLAVLLIVLGILDALGTADGLTDVPPAALLGPGAALVLAVGALWRAYRHRRDLPLSEVTDGLVVDSRVGELRDRQGNRLSALDSVRVAVRIDWWWTRTLMRLVVVRWPERSKIVFRTVNRRRAREVAKLLVDAGVGKPPH